MKKLSITSFINLLFIFISEMMVAQVQFLEQRPYEAPSFEQYSSSACVDHHHPYTNVTDNFFLRFDGTEFNNNINSGDCLNGRSCYDGHPGTDYFMPFNTPILAPAGGYVLWASFSPAADPCPGEIVPNGEQGTIIIAHGNDYFTVYLHMTSPLEVEVGQTVEAGDTLGYAGDTGCATSTHLHFEVRKGNWFFDSIEPYVVDPFGWWGNFTDPIEEFRGNRSEWLWLSEFLVDDGDNGFERFRGPDWTYLSQGHNGDSWIAPSTQHPNESRHYAMWSPTIETGIEHDIEIFIPSGIDVTNGAIYEIYIKGESGTSTKTDTTIDQSANQDTFVNIGTVILNESESLAIILRDIVTPSSSGPNVVFDAIRVKPSTTSAINPTGSNSNQYEKIKIRSAYPNPFNSSVIVNYEVRSSTSIQVNVHSVSGTEILSKNINSLFAGDHLFSWDGKNKLGSDCPSGVYFFSITSDAFYQSKKIVYLK